MVVRFISYTFHVVVSCSCALNFIFADHTAFAVCVKYTGREIDAFRNWNSTAKLYEEAIRQDKELEKMHKDGRDVNG